ncbi:MAG: hypothetical protein UY63_C0004G0050 [Parcubacteria group bacterium GW2011_GWA2_51_10]|nr:MAG: hypothetical protein UY63_C0004G0050 [Parcubacteria group bacterium GW2011_GWA2_51_10]
MTAQLTLKETAMLYLAALFFAISVVAAFFGFGGFAAGTAKIGVILFFVFLVLAFIVGLIKFVGRAMGLNDPFLPTHPDDEPTQ